MCLVYSTVSRNDKLSRSEYLQSPGVAHLVRLRMSGRERGCSASALRQCYERSLVMNESFNGKVALVTGAGAGMGLATAKAFAEAGALPVIAGSPAEGGPGRGTPTRDPRGQATPLASRWVG